MKFSTAINVCKSLEHRGCTIVSVDTNTQPRGGSWKNAEYKAEQIQKITLNRSCLLYERVTKGYVNKVQKALATQGITTKFEVQPNRVGKHLKLNSTQIPLLTSTKKHDGRYQYYLELLPLNSGEVHYLLPDGRKIHSLKEIGWKPPIPRKTKAEPSLSTQANIAVICPNIKNILELRMFGFAVK